MIGFRLEDVVAAEVHEEGYNSYDNDAEDDVYPHEGAVILDQFTVTHDEMVMGYGLWVIENKSGAIVPRPSGR